MAHKTRWRWLTLGLMVLVACGRHAGTSPDALLRYPMTQDIRTWDPAFFWDIAHMELFQNV
jgi:hypothetical protein